MKIERRTRRIGLITAAALVLVGASSAFGARSPMSSTATAVADSSDVLAIERAANGRLLAIGRLDKISRANYSVSVLNQSFVLLASSGNTKFIASAKVGHAVALFGQLNRGKYFVDAALSLDGQYVQGASKVYLRGPVRSVDAKLGSISVGAAHFYTAMMSSRFLTDRVGKGAIIMAVGTQPVLGGQVLVERIRKAGAVDASLGTGRANASLGTGRSEASLGTGRSEASLGTGRTNASLGTGRTNASLGTGKPDASLGTGRSEASLGTGKSSN